MRKIVFLLAMTTTAHAGLITEGTTTSESERYRCEVRKAVGVEGGSGAKIRLSGAPAMFSLEIGAGPIFGDQLRAAPKNRTNVYLPEEGPTFVARIDAALFATPADRLISHDRRSFSDGRSVFTLSEHGTFIAHGPALGEVELGAAIYAGVCAISK